MINFLKKSTTKFNNTLMIFIRGFNKERKEKTLMKNSMKLKAIRATIKRQKIIVRLKKKERVNLKN